MEILQGNHRRAIMKNDLVQSAVDGFFGSFKLVATIVMALVGVISGFINGNSGTDQESPHSKLHQ